MWKVKTKVVPIVIGALGTVFPRLRTCLNDIKVATRIKLIQKSTFLGIARVIRKVLNI